MTYACDKCGRSFACGESISFCPFCGKAYAGGQEPSLRITVGSDSGRAVQTKYWNLCHQALWRASYLIASLAPSLQPEERYLDWAQWLSQQRHCQSTAQFKRRCDAYLAKLGELLRGNIADEEQEPVDVQALAADIDRDCLSLLEAIEGAPSSIQPPVLDYQPHEPECGRPSITEAHLRLHKQLEQCKAVLYAILDENGMFVALSPLGEEEDEEQPRQYAPARLTQQLAELARRDYDPIFGEGYDELIETFWDAVRCLTDIANQALELPQLDEDEQAKQTALKTYLTDWKTLLTRQLDRLYESQTADMMDVCDRLSRAEQALMQKE